MLALAPGGLVRAADPDALTLHEAYALALRQSEQVDIAAVNRELASGAYTGALTAIGPSVAVTTTATYQNYVDAPAPPGQPAGSLQPPYSVTTRALAALPIFRRSVFDARRAAKLGVEGADALLVRARQQLMIDVATAFIGVLQARQQVTISQNALNRADAQAQVVTGQLRAGGALKTAELLAQLDVRRAQAQLVASQGVLRQHESSFERLVGVPAPAHLDLPPTPMKDAYVDLDRTGPVRRPDLRALHLATDQARATVTYLQNKIFWPILDLNLYAGYVHVANTSPTATTDLSYPIYGLTGAVTVPLFQTGDEWLQVRLQRQRVSLAVDQESLLRRQIDDDVRQALARIETANRAIDVANEQVKIALQNYQQVTTVYKLGRATALEVTTALNFVSEAETSRLQAAYERELATYTLLFSEGKIDL